jgi:hypothetical protein
MVYSNAYTSWETTQRLTCHYDLFGQTVRLQKAESKGTFVCFSAAPGTVHEHRRTVYCCRRQLAIRALLRNSQCSYIVDSDTHRMHCCDFTANWLRERAAVLRYTLLPNLAGLFACLQCVLCCHKQKLLSQWLCGAWICVSRHKIEATLLCSFRLLFGCQ